jgi:hypothetical protein
MKEIKNKYCKELIRARAKMCRQLYLLAKCERELQELKREFSEEKAPVDNSNTTKE